MILCPRCGYQNSNEALYCKNCGEPLIPKQTPQRNYIPPKESNNKIIILSITIIIIVLIIAGTILLLSNNNQDAKTAINTPENQSNTTNTTAQPTQSQPTQATQTAQATQTGTPLKILSGSFKTGSSLSDKTYITVYVGEEHAGEKVKIKVLYKRDGSQLNPGNIVDKTVDSSGMFTMASANSFKYYPDYAYITLYDANENIVDTMEVNINPTSGTQTF